MSGKPLVTVFVRVRDEERALAEVLDRLGRQQLSGGMEIIVLDNESVDDSAGVALRAGARVFTLPRSLFGYGRALNLGVELARGEIVVLLSAHSVPQDERWLGRFVEPLTGADPVDAAYCRQVPHGIVCRLERRRFAMFPATPERLDREGFLAGCAAGADPYELARFSNSAAAVQRSSALANPFRDLPYAEDRAFAVDHLMGGGSVAYVPEAVVSYERSGTWRNSYHVARRAQVAKRLVRELAAVHTGRRLGSARDTANRLLRAAAVGPGLALRLVATLAEPPALRRRAVRFALRSTGSTLGLAVGALTWRHHVETLVPDPMLYEEALRRCRSLTAT
jgi:glycosyltransferase involved in cell wall biosynthesis